MKKKILLVFFEAFKLKEIKNLLEKYDFQVVIAFDGAEGYEIFKSEKPDLVVTEALLPRVHGFELCRRIRTDSEGKIPVIIITGTYKGTKFKNEAITKYQANAFLEYPFDENEFLAILKNLLQKEEELFKTIPIKADTKEYLKTPEEKKVSSAELFGTILKEIEDKVKKETEEKIDFQVFNRKEEIKPQKKDIEKEIEDDFEKKLEETLSGLGIKVKVKPSSESKIVEEKPPIQQVIKEEPSKGEVKEEPLITTEELPSVEAPERKDLLEEIKLIQEMPVFEPPSPPSEERAETIKVEIPGQETLGDYILEEKIATGGMAELFKAKRKGVEGFEKTLAVKRILSTVAEDRELVEMLIDEAKIASQLTHPNIVQIFDLGKKDNSYFIAMEYVHGKDLRTILKTLNSKKKLLPYELSAYITIKICDALYYAHNKTDTEGKPLKIVHRDVSPQNILISYDGEVKLADFGIAKASTKLHQTVAGQIKGKMLYMSPEQSKGSKGIDWRTDIFSLGCVLFEMVTSKKLFMADSEMAVLEKVQKGKIVKPSSVNPEVPAQLESIILKALKLRPSDRYQSAIEMKKDLEKFILSRRRSLPDNYELSLFMAELFPGEFSVAPSGEKKEAYIEKEVKRAPEVLKFLIEEEKKRKFPVMPVAIFSTLLILSALGFFAYNFLYLPKLKKPSETELTYIPKEIPPKSEIKKETPLKEVVKKEESVTEVKKESVPETSPSEKSIREYRNLREETSKIRESRKDVELRKSEKREALPSIQVKNEEEPKVEKIEEKKIEEKKIEEKKIEESKSEEIQKVEVSEPEKVESVEPQKKEPEPKPVEEVKVQPPPVKEGDLVKIEDVDIRPSVTSKVLPKITIAAERVSAHGEILLSVLISETGNVLDVKLIRGVSKTLGMNEEAMKAVRKWKFSPALKSGKRVKVWMLVLVKF